MSLSSTPPPTTMAVRDCSRLIDDMNDQRNLFLDRKFSKIVCRADEYHQENINHIRPSDFRSAFMEGLRHLVTEHTFVFDAVAAFSALIYCGPTCVTTTHWPDYGWPWAPAISIVHPSQPPCSYQRLRFTSLVNHRLIAALLGPGRAERKAYTRLVYYHISLVKDLLSISSDSLAWPPLECHFDCKDVFPMLSSPSPKVSTPTLCYAIRAV